MLHLERKSVAQCGKPDNTLRIDSNPRLPVFYPEVQAATPNSAAEQSAKAALES